MAESKTNEGGGVMQKPLLAPGLQSMFTYLIYFLLVTTGQSFRRNASFRGKGKNGQEGSPFSFLSLSPENEPAKQEVV